ncbi:hypothetical protein [Cohnella sp. 56]|uniref:hypothetical protein n=1 Tax=Cohnella sp. 56 TaxID=3113722 RepID=UPI0030E8FBB8
MKKWISILLLGLLLTGCAERGNEALNHNTQEVTPTPSSTSISNPSPAVESPSPTGGDYDQNLIRERMKGKERKGKLKIDDIKNNGLDKELLKTVNVYLKAMQEQDKDKILEMRHPKAFQEGNILSLYTSSTYMSSVDEVSLDSKRKKEVAKEYDLDASKIAIVVVNVTSTSGTKGSANLIFVKDGKWMIYKTD